MHHFFTTPEEIGEEYIRITGPDVNHIRNVLRMKLGETMLISDGQGKDYCCELAELGESEVLAKITDAEYEGTEPVCEFYLFQGLPKSDKMELIVQKAVELGVKEIIPVATKRAVVKLDEKKAQKKQERWQAIAESAAKLNSPEEVLYRKYQRLWVSKKHWHMQKVWIKISFHMRIIKTWKKPEKYWMRFRKI